MPRDTPTIPFAHDVVAITQHHCIESQAQVVDTRVAQLTVALLPSAENHAGGLRCWG